MQSVYHTIAAIAGLICAIILGMFMYSLTKGMGSYVEKDILVRQIACFATLPYYVPENATIASEFNVKKFNTTIRKGEVIVDDKLYYLSLIHI